VRAAEVAVLGAGIAGAAVARELAVRGVGVVLVDRAGVSEGTTGRGEGNVLCSDKDAGPELELTRHGLDVYAELEERLGAEARIRRKGALMVHPDAGTWAAEPARLERLRAAGVDGTLLSADEVRELEPNLDGALHGASRFVRDLQCDPARIARALAREAVAAGAEVRAGCAVERIAVAGGRVAGLDTARGRIAAGAVVLAAGPWSAALAAGAGLPLPLEPRKGQLVRLRTPAARDGAPWVRHKVVDGSYLGAVLSGDAGLQISTVVETTWDGDVLVGSSRERRGFDLEPDEAVSAALLERASRLFGGLRELPRVAAWAGLRPWLPDHLPAIGPSEAVPGLWLATGHEGSGVALGPVTGRVLAQAYCGETPLMDLRPFTPDRFAAGAAAPAPAGRRGA
jgi:glycine/D-amino acid oxidase-like deaminating enzyme